MGHGLERRANGTASFAYQGKPGWHRLGQQAPAGSTGAQMAVIAGVDYEVQLRNVYTDGFDGLKRPLHDYRALTRSDNGDVFGIVSSGYTLEGHQPADILSFFDAFAADNGLGMETVGAIAGGSRIWALARAPKLVGRVGPLGVSSDEVRGFLLMAAGYDGGFGLRGKATKVRVVCQNTWHASGIGGRGDVFKMTHTAAFDRERRAEAARALGLQVHDFEQSLEVANALASRTCTDREATSFYRQLLKMESAEQLAAALAATAKPAAVVTETGGFSLAGLGLNVPGLSVVEPASVPLPFDAATVAAIQADTKSQVNEAGQRVLARLLQSREVAPGAQMESARGTWWGAVNALTYDADHYGTNADTRQNSAWFGQGASRTARGFGLALEMAGLKSPQVVEVAPLAMAAE